MCIRDIHLQRLGFCLLRKYKTPPLVSWRTTLVGWVGVVESGIDQEHDDSDKDNCHDDDVKKTSHL